MSKKKKKTIIKQGDLKPSKDPKGGGKPKLITQIYKPGPISIPDPPPYEVNVNLNRRP